MKVYNLNSAENSKLVADEGLQYKLLYFGMHFAGTSARGILAYANADWEPIYPLPVTFFGIKLTSCPPPPIPSVANM